MATHHLTPQRFGGRELRTDVNLLRTDVNQHRTDMDQVRTEIVQLRIDMTRDMELLAANLSAAIERAANRTLRWTIGTVVALFTALAGSAAAIAGILA